MDQKVKEAIDSLSKIDLSKPLMYMSRQPFDKIDKSIKSLGKVGNITTHFHPGKIFWRGRVNYNGETFLGKTDLSFKPAEHCHDFQRANFPYSTMFYGSLLPENSEDDKLPPELVTIALELLPWLREEKTSGIQKITFSRWIVKEKINLVAILQNSDFRESMTYSRDLYKAFIQFLNDNPLEKENTLVITDFFANEFAKVDTIPDFKYLLSAYWTDFIISQGFDGVLYPSVRSIGKGLNVAIKPNIVETHLTLSHVLQSVVYKHKAQCWIDNDFVSEINGNKSKFEYTPLTDEPYHLGIDKVLKKLGVKSALEIL